MCTSLYTETPWHITWSAQTHQTTWHDETHTQHSLILNETDCLTHPHHPGWLLCTSQCEFPEHTQGILTFEKMCCQSPLYGSKVPCHKCISALWVYIDFYVKMFLDGCSIPNTGAFIQIPGTRSGACEGHTDKLFPVRKSLGEWVGIDRK